MSFPFFRKPEPKKPNPLKSPRDKSISPREKTRQETGPKSPNESSGDDLFGDMILEFSPPQTAPATAHHNQSHVETVPLSNISELEDLVLPTSLAGGESKDSDKTTSSFDFIGEDSTLTSDEDTDNTNDQTNDNISDGVTTKQTDDQQRQTETEQESSMTDDSNDRDATEAPVALEQQQQQQQQQQQSNPSKERRKKKKLKTNFACLPGRSVKAKLTKSKTSEEDNEIEETDVTDCTSKTLLPNSSEDNESTDGGSNTLLPDPQGGCDTLLPDSESGSKTLLPDPENDSNALLPDVGSGSKELHLDCERSESGSGALLPNPTTSGGLEELVKSEGFGDGQKVNQLLDASGGSPQDGHQEDLFGDDMVVEIDQSLDTSDGSQQDDLFDDDMVVEIDNQEQHSNQKKLVDQKPSPSAQTSDDVGNNNDNIDKSGVDSNIDNGAETSSTSDDGGSENTYAVEFDLTEEEKILLEIDGLNMKKENLLNEEERLRTAKKSTLDQWRCTRVDVDAIPSQIDKLRQEQHIHAEKEDFDKADAIQQQIRDLSDSAENYKFQYPILSKEIIELVHTFKSTLLQNAKDKEQLLIQYQLTIKRHQGLMTKKEQEKSSSEALSQKSDHSSEMHFKAEKLELDRQLSHLTLDKEILIKNHSLLHQQIEEKTDGLYTERTLLVEKQKGIRVEIEEFEQKLKELRHEETNCSQQIDNINGNIESIKQDFQPRLVKVEEERKENDDKETEVQRKLIALESKIEEANKSKKKFEAEKKRNLELLETLQQNIKAIDEHELCGGATGDDKDVGGGNDFSFEMLFDIKCLVQKDDPVLQSMKADLVEHEESCHSLKEKIQVDESRTSLLQRSLNELEAQIGDLTKSKQSAVKERKYMDAKRLTEEIKQVTGEGEQKQQRLLEAENNLKNVKSELAKTTQALEAIRGEYSAKLKVFDCKIIENLRTVNADIDLFLIRHKESWYKEILELQSSTNEDIIKHLQTKHDIKEDDIIHHSPVSNDNKDSDDGSNVVDGKSKLTEFELKLKEAEEREDWDLAAQLNDQITALQSS